MGTRFILGRAGSGKTHFLHERLVEYIQPDPLNRGAILLVPRQATFTAERAIATDARLNGFIHVRVIAPDDLGELALVETGASAGAKLDAVGRGLILSHLLRTHADQLIHFGRSATQPGLASEIDRAFSEFERSGRDLCEIDDLIAGAAQSDDTTQQALGRKLDDLCRLYKLYQQYLRDHGFDAFNRQSQAIEAIEKYSLIQQSLVLIDDFYDFTAYERSLIVAVAKTARHTDISILLDPASPIVKDVHWLPPETDVLHRTEMTYRKLHFDLLKAGVALESPLLLKDHPRFKAPELRAVENIQHGPAEPADSTGAATRIVAVDRHDEADAAAREIKSLLAKGYRLRDICVLARSVEEYDPLIAASFAEHDISYFVDKRRPARHHPLIRALRAIVLIARSRWSLEAVLELARCGLAGIASGDADLLEDYIRQHNIPPSAWRRDEAWMFHRPAEGEETVSRSQFTDEEVERVNALRVRLRVALATTGDAPWAESSMPVRQRVADVFAALDALGTRDAMLYLVKDAEAASRIQDRDEHLQVWSRAVELADQIVDLLGDVSLTGGTFAQLFEQSLNELDLAITPPTLDQVLVGSIERTRPREPRAVLLLGMNAGQFPLARNEQPILNDRDRHALQTAGIEVEASSRQAMLDERFLGYLALTRATERLILLRTACDERGNELEASPFWQLLDSGIRNAPIETPAGPVERIGTPLQAVSHLLAWAREMPGEAKTDDAASLYDWLVRSPTNAVRAVRDRAWPVLKYDNAPKLSPGIAAKLFTSRLESSVSRFESFAACPFQHFVRYGLRLQQPPKPDITAMDLGSLYHGVLEKLIRKSIEQHADFAKSAELSPEQIRAIAQEVGEQLRHQVFLSSARNRYTLERLEQVIHRLIRAQQFVADRGAFRPGFAELAFGRHGTLPPLELKTPKGNTVVLSGKIDRVDIDPVANRFTVIDYKLSGEQLSLGNVAHGLMLQLLTYLLVIDAHGEKLAGKRLTPAAALYVKLLRSIESTKDPSQDPEPDTPEFHAKSKPHGLINADAADELDASFASTGKSDVYLMKRTKNGSLSEKGNDAVEVEQFEQLVAFVHDKIIELADQIIEGRIMVAPYLIGGDTPCGHCPFTPVCRFDRLINRYHVLPRLSRKEALQLITGDGGAA